MKIICFILSLIFIINTNSYSQPVPNTLRIPVGEHQRVETALQPETIEDIKKRIADFVGTHIGNRYISSLDCGYLPFDIDQFIDFIQNRNHNVFQELYEGSLISFADDLINIPGSPAYILLMEYLKPNSLTYIYREPWQHSYIEESLPSLLAEKIKKRKGKEPIYIKLATLGGGLDPISIGTTLKEAIEVQLKTNYPDLIFEKDVFLNISNMEISPDIIKKTKSRLIKDPFTISDIKEGSYKERKKRLAAINKNRPWFSNNINFILGSIANKTLVKTILKDKPDFIVCNNCFYQLDVPHQIDFINFMGQNIPKNTEFIFSCDAIAINNAVRSYTMSTLDYSPLDDLICSTIKPYPPLFEKYFNIVKQHNNSVVMKRKPYVEILGAAINDNALNEAQTIQVTNQELYERLKAILSRTAFDDNAIAQDRDTIKLLCFYYKYYPYYFDMEKCSNQY